MATNQNIRIIPLGGVDEFGKNITVVEYGNDMVVVDCGSVFPESEMLGVDLVIPDVTYLIKNRDKLRGLLLTHGHEDHIGGIPYVLRQVPMPLYGTKLTLALVDLKLKEHRIAGTPLHVIEPSQEIDLGALHIKFLHVNHSIAGAVAIAITCPAGTIVFSGDFKVDYTPIDGHVTDLAGFAELGTKGVLAFLCESTNIERKGYTMSETKVGETFLDMFRQAAGRVIVAMFASNIHRIQMIVDSAIEFGRKVCFVGRSMVNVTRAALSIGELQIDERYILDIDDLENYNDDQILIVTTGSQGEAMAGLTRMANGEHRKIHINPTDTVILSAHPIPGNEKPVARVINQLYRCGAIVIYGQLGEVHVSGHACQEEIKLLHTLLRPKYFLPIHGEYSKQWQHAELAAELGMPNENIIIPELGNIIEIGANTFNIVGEAPTGELMVDGLGIGDVGSVVLRDRKHLSEDGLIIISFAIDRDTGKILAGPDIITRGFIFVRENDDIIQDVRDLSTNLLSSAENQLPVNSQDLKLLLKDEVRKFIFEKIKRNPMILPVSLDI